MYALSSGPVRPRPTLSVKLPFLLSSVSREYACPTLGFFPLPGSTVVTVSLIGSGLPVAERDVCKDTSMRTGVISRGAAGATRGAQNGHYGLHEMIAHA